MKKKNKGTIEFDKSTITCDVSMTQCEYGTIKWEKNKNKGTTKCDKSIVTCDVGTAQCKNGTIECEKKIKNHQIWQKYNTIKYDVLVT